MEINVTDQLQKRVGDILSMILDSVQQAKDFALTQLPDIAQSYVAYGRVWLTVKTSLFFLFLLIVLGGWVKTMFTKGGVANQAFRNQEEWVYPVGIFGSIIGAVIWFTMLDCALDDLQETILVWFAPKVWLIQELAHLIHPVVPK